MGPKTKHPKRRNNRNNRAHGATLPVCVYKDIPLMLVDTVEQSSLTVQQIVASCLSTYAIDIVHISIEVTAPSFVTAASTLVPVDAVYAQVFGYMIQDVTLQRTPMSTWRSIDKDKPTRFSFNRAYIVKHIYAGGKIPITIVNADLCFGIQARWSSGSDLSGAVPHMSLTWKTRVLLQTTQPLKQTHITASGETKSYKQGSSFLEQATVGDVTESLACMVMADKQVPVSSVRRSKK